MKGPSVTATIPKPEYPRPDRDRSARWLPLNGTWTLDTGEEQQPITVPYAWETPASGVARTWLEHATYRRTATVPADWDRSRVFLCFGAVHHQATILLDGDLVGTHTGGYTSFEYDITDQVIPSGAFQLEVEVWAPADKRSIPHGKQRSMPRDDYDGVCFTPSSGIWQSVWLEARGRTYADLVTIRGDSLDGFDVTLQLQGDHPAGASVTVGVDQAPDSPLHLIADEHGRATGRLDLDQPLLWSPTTPHLYHVTVTTADDQVRLTAGLRSIECRGTSILLNGEPLYLRGVLDQGYWPGTGITAPDDAALVRDLELARDCGYNLIRKHLKLEEARFLHWADTLGILVWAEPASTSRYSPEGATNFEAQIPAMVQRDGNHPSIIIWSLYNEEWGLDWDIPGNRQHADAARHAYDMLAALDHSRPIVENSGWAHVKTDLLDWHYYAENPADWNHYLAGIANGTTGGFPVRLGPDFVVEKTLTADGAPDARRVPNLNSEYGGGFTSVERAWHMRWQTQELRRHNTIAGYVYTELADVEHESAGIYDSHRNPKDTAGLRPADSNAETVLILDIVPAQAGTDIAPPEQEWTLPVRLSHHGPDLLSGTVHAAWTAGGHRLEQIPQQAHASAKLAALPHSTSAAVHLQIPASPTRRARLLIWHTSENASVTARTFIDAGPLEHTQPHGQPDASSLSAVTPFGV